GLLLRVVPAQHPVPVLRVKHPLVALVADGHAWTAASRALEHRHRCVDGPSNSRASAARCRLLMRRIMGPASAAMTRPKPRMSGCGWSVTRHPSGAGSTRYVPLGLIMPAHSPSKSIRRSGSTLVTASVESNVWPIAFDT